MSTIFVLKQQLNAFYGNADNKNSHVSGTGT